MELIKYYEYLQALEYEKMKELKLKQDHILYKNWVGYVLVTIYGVKTKENAMNVHFIFTNCKNEPYSICLTAYSEGGYSYFLDLDPLPEFLKNRINKNDNLQNKTKFYLHRVLVSIALNINNLQIHHIDRNTMNDRIDNLLPVTLEEHDLIHELENNESTIVYSDNISDKGALTSYTKNSIIRNIIDGRLSEDLAATITGYTVKEIQKWKALYRKYGRVPFSSAKPVTNNRKLPEFYVINILNLYYIEKYSPEDIAEHLKKKKLFNPATRSNISLKTIKNYIDAHPCYLEWYQNTNQSVYQ
jgi:hypothetical protein